MAILLADAFTDGALKSALVEYVTAQRGAALAASGNVSRPRLPATAHQLARAETKIGEVEKLRRALSAGEPGR